MHKTSHIFLGCVFMLMGVMGVIGSSKFVFMDKGLPGPGFFPMTLSVLTIVFSALVLFSTLKLARDAIDMALVKRVALFLLFLAASLAILPGIIGLLPALIVFYVLALYFWNKVSLPKAIVNGLVCMAVLYGTFVAWLGVDMPWGLFEYLLQ